MKQLLITPLILASLTGIGFAEETKAEKPAPYFGVAASFMTSTQQPWQLGVQAGVANLIGPLGLRGSAGIRLGAGGPSYGFQGNVTVGGASTVGDASLDQLDLYAGLGYGVRREVGTETRWSHGPNVLAGLEYALAPRFSLTLEGQTDYLFNTLPNITPWRFGVSVGARIYLN
jgi:hypothetical protein